MAYEVVWKPAALKDLRPIPKRDLQRIKTRVQSLKQNPRLPGAEKLRGPVDGYRLRVGQYRILYVVDDGRRVAIIGRVGHRKDIYR